MLILSQGGQKTKVVTVPQMVIAIEEQREHVTNASKENNGRVKEAPCALLGLKLTDRPNILKHD